MPNNAYYRIAGCALIAGLVLPGTAGCSRAGESVSSGVSAFPSGVQATISGAEAAPAAGAPGWCRTLDNPAVTALANVLPQLVTNQASAAVPKVHAAATVLRNAAASAPTGPGLLLNAAAGSLNTAADAKSPTSLQAVGRAFTSLGKGVQSTCGFH